ncbi:MAG: S1 family peptidase [Pseudomonadota bacterium]
MEHPWNEMSAPPELEEALLTVIARNRSGALRAVGTAFVVRALPDRALAITAAHVLREVHRLQLGQGIRTHPTIPSEFAPRLPPIDLSAGNLVLATVNRSQLVFAVAVGLAFDEDGDFAVLDLRPQEAREGDFPLREFILDDRMPDRGQLIGIASYRYPEVHFQEPQTLRVARQPALRVGKVTAVFPSGQRLCRGPCFETSIPVYSGMSGGPVLSLQADGRLLAIGLVCSDPDLDGPSKDDRSTAGRSLVAKLPVRRVAGNAKARQEVELTFKLTVGAGSFSPRSRP